jgi:hypothetical protein
MSYELDPVAGQWYRQIDKGQLFRVVSIDEDDDLIAIQYFDGDAEELDSETWFTLDLDLTETPEDWIDPDADHDTDEAAKDGEPGGTDKRKPRKASKKPSEDWDDDEDEDEGDDWDDDDEEDGYGSDE